MPVFPGYKSRGRSLEQMQQSGHEPWRQRIVCFGTCTALLKVSGRCRFVSLAPQSAASDPNTT
jgi:hypothetical protein